MTKDKGWLDSTTDWILGPLGNPDTSGMGTELDQSQRKTAEDDSNVSADDQANYAAELKRIYSDQCFLMTFRTAKIMQLWMVTQVYWSITCYKMSQLRSF
jgi:hypothetical protein